MGLTTQHTKRIQRTQHAHTHHNHTQQHKKHTTHTTKHNTARTQHSRKTTPQPHTTTQKTHNTHTTRSESQLTEHIPGKDDNASYRSYHGIVPAVVTAVNTASHSEWMLISVVFKNVKFEKTITIANKKKKSKVCSLFNTISNTKTRKKKCKVFLVYN